MIKSIKIYEMLSDDVKKKWYSRQMITQVYPKKFKDDEDWQQIIDNRKIKRTEFLVQTVKYQKHLLHSPKDNYEGMMYEVKKFYRRIDIDNIYDSLDWSKESRTVRTVHLRHDSSDTIRQHLQDVSSFSQNTVSPVIFYGEKKKDCNVNYQDQYRLYYGLFYNYTMIKEFFCLEYRITPAQLDVLQFLYMYKFFTATDLKNFGKQWLGADRLALVVYRTFQDELKLVEPLKIESRKAKSKIQKRRRLSTLTTKGNLIVEDFMDCIMYKRKVKYSGLAMTTVATSYADKEPTFENEKFTRMNTKYRAYIAYQSVYEHINSKLLLEVFDEGRINFMNKLTVNDFKYNFMVYSTLENRFLEQEGEYTKKQKEYLESFLGSTRFKYTV